MMKLTIFTSSIFPDVTRVWYYFINKCIDFEDTTVAIYDCGARLKSEHFFLAEIFKFPNIEHGKKIDNFITCSCATPFLFICDDDAFVLDRTVIESALKYMENNSNCAAYSFKFRDWWSFKFNNKQYYPMGSYAVIINVNIIKNEMLSMATKRTDNDAIRRGTGYYDTSDYACEQLIRKGYEIKIAPARDRKLLPAFYGTSSGFRSLTKKVLFSSHFTCKRHPQKITQKLKADSYHYQRACAVAAVKTIYKKLFSESPRLKHFFTLSDLEFILQTIPEPQKKDYTERYNQVYRVYLKLLKNSAHLKK